MTSFRKRPFKRGRTNIRPRFTVGQQVIITRDLPSLPVNSEGTIRGLTPSPRGTTYAIRFYDGMHIVQEHDLRATNTHPPTTN